MTVHRRVQVRMYPSPSYSAPAIPCRCSQFPPAICRACRPTPCPHSACKRDAFSVRLPKLGGAGGALLIMTAGRS